MFRLFLTLPIILSACLKDETVSGYADPQTVYSLQEISGTPFSAQATITFPQEGRVAGRAPCNSYSTSQSAPYPWLDLGPIAATRAACADLAQEKVFFTTLSQMTQIEVLDGLLILRNDANQEMVFRVR